MSNKLSDLYSISQIREIENLAKNKFKIAEKKLMETAGVAAFQAMRHAWASLKNIMVLCGKGNNAGDGYVLARLATQAGFNVSVRHLGQLQDLSSVALDQALACQAIGVDIKPFDPQQPLDADILVDALLGIGIKGEVRAEYAFVVQAINQATALVLAIDVPSGLNADTGDVCGRAVEADLTVTFIGMKRGLVTAHGPAYCGELIVCDLDLPVAAFIEVPPAALVIEEVVIDLNLSPRSRDAHKGDFGHVLIIGGNTGMPGAVRMAAEAAGRVGAGLVTVATRKEHITAMAGSCPEVMCKAVEKPDDLDDLLNRATVLVVGPGLGKDEWAQALFDKVLQSELPKVIDADALNLLAENSQKVSDSILTPHPGEAGRLLSSDSKAIQADRYQAAKQLQQKYKGVIVLKGSGSIVQVADKLPQVCVAGNPGMATGGMGDVLSGIIGGLIAQKLDLATAASTGVQIHAMAADIAAATHGERGMLALDLMPHIQELVNP